MKVRILKVDGSVEKMEVDIRPVVADVVDFGTELRKNDPFVAAIRVDGIEKYTWVGHANDIQEMAKVKAERDGINW